MKPWDPPGQWGWLGVFGFWHCGLPDVKWCAFALPTDSSNAIAGGVAAAYLAQFFKNARRASTSEVFKFLGLLIGTTLRESVKNELLQ